MQGWDSCVVFKYQCGNLEVHIFDLVCNLLLMKLAVCFCLQENLCLQTRAFPVITQHSAVLWTDNRGYTKTSSGSQTEAVRYMESSPDGCKRKFVVTYLKFSDIIGKNFILQCCVQWLQIHEHNKLINYFYMFHMSF